MSGKTKRTNVESNIAELTLGKVQIRDGSGGAFVVDIDDPGIGHDCMYVQTVPVPIAGAGVVEGGAAVPAAATNVTTLAGIAATPLARGLVLQAMVANAGAVAVGMTNTVNPTAGAEVGMQLLPGQSYPVPGDNTDNVYARSTNGTDRITWTGG